MPGNHSEPYQTDIANVKKIVTPKQGMVVVRIFDRQTAFGYTFAENVFISPIHAIAFG
jgi:hypothetical protein